jgi:signal transduction histidine kinase
VSGDNDMVRTWLRGPFTARTVRRVLFCLVSGALGMLCFVPFVLLTVVTFGLLTPVLGRALGRVHRGLVNGLLEPLAEPSGNRAGWRGAGYVLLKFPLAIPQAYAVLCWCFGIANLTYPLWWPLFRNHPAGTRLGPVVAVTPFGLLHIATYPGTALVAVVGAAMLWVSPWVARGATWLDLAAARPLLGPDAADPEVARLRDSRARAVDDAAALARQLERDLHDGTQLRLATLALNLGMATEKLGTDGPPPDLDQARDLLGAAHRGAKDTLAELRRLVRGMHPPVLDSGLPEALGSLVAESPIPVTLTVDVPARPSPAIETIAYFCAAELIGNAAKHSHAARVELDVATRGDRLAISAYDDGVGGATSGRGGGTGLAGLADRIGTVDGQLHVDSPAGGPTRIDVLLPLTA